MPRTVQQSNVLMDGTQQFVFGAVKNRQALILSPPTPIVGTYSIMIGENPNSQGGFHMVSAGDHLILTRELLGADIDGPIHGQAVGGGGDVFPVVQIVGD